MKRAAAFLLLAAGLEASEGAAYLKVPQGARSSAMASAMAASVGNAEGMWYSPATLPGLRGVEASFSRLAWVGDTKNDFLALAVPLGSTQSQGLGLYGNLISTEDVYRDNYGVEGAKFANSATVLGGAYGISFGWLALGLGIKGAQDHFAGLNTHSLCFDSGVQLRLAKGAFRLAAATQNMGNQSSLQSNLGRVQPPLTYRSAMALESRRLGLQATLEHRMLPESGESTFCTGAEYAFKAGGLGFALRAGYEGASARIGGLSGLTLGGGFEMAGLVADFAWLPQGALGSPYRMSLGWRFASDPRFQAPETPSQDQPAKPAASPMSREEKVKDLLTLAKVEQSMGEMKAAEQAYKKASDLAPEDYRVWKEMGQFYYAQGNKAGALLCFDKVQALKPTPAFKAWLDQYRNAE